MGSVFNRAHSLCTDIQCYENSNNVDERDGTRSGQALPPRKNTLWDGEFWIDGYFVTTVAKHGNDYRISDYVRKQGSEYQELREDRQLSLF